MTKEGTGAIVGAVVDVSEKEQVEDWIKNVVAAENAIDVIVSNVSSLSIPNTPENWALAYQTDLMGTVSLVNAALPHLEKSKGNIITISSGEYASIWNWSAPLQARGHANNCYSFRS